jgi:hypothetical protein
MQIGSPPLVAHSGPTDQAGQATQAVADQFRNDLRQAAEEPAGMGDVIYRRFLAQDRSNFTDRVRETAHDDRAGS